MEYRPLHVLAAFAERRRELGLTLDTLAVKSGVSKSALSRYERGEMGVPRNHCRLLSEALERDPVSLFDYPSRADAGATFAALRSARGWTQVGLGREIGKSSGYIAALERGGIPRPPASVRVSLAAVLELALESTFAAFAPPEEEWHEARRRISVRLCRDERLSTIAAAKRLGIASGSVQNELRAAGVVAKPAASDAIPAGRVSASAAAPRHGMKPESLRAAIAAGRIRGGKVEVAGGKFVYHVDLAELAEDIANAPRCLYEGCEKPGLSPSGTCSGAHAMALLTRGPWWGTDEGRTWREAMARDPDGARRRECFLCGRVESQSPAFSAARDREGRRNLCSSCWGPWHAAISASMAVLRRDVEQGENGRPDPFAHVQAETSDAFEAVLKIAEEHAPTILAGRPRLDGRPRQIAMNITIEVFNAWGFRDHQINHLIETSVRAVNPRYVEWRRHTAGIRRHRRPRVSM